MRVASIIPARGGSKGVPKKNLRLLDGSPLITHTIRAAMSASKIDRVIVTTDDEEIALVSAEWGAEIVKRPAELADDEASSEAALIHALDQLKDHEGYIPDLVVFLQCTSPIRRIDDLDAAISQMLESQLDSLLSVSVSHRFLWQRKNNLVTSLNYDYRNRPRRQDFDPQYVENGSFYIFSPSVLRNTGNRIGGKIGLFIMPEECALEIDSETDFLLCEALIAARKS